MISNDISGVAETLHQLFDHAPALVVLLAGEEHRFAYANPAYQALIGREVHGRTVREAVPELAEQGFVGVLDQVFGTGEPFRGEGMLVRLLGASGALEDCYFDFVYQPVRSPSGTIIGVFGQGTDVTSRVRSELALRESEATVELATRAAAIGVWDWRPQTNLWTFSSHARKIWGFADDVMITQQLLADAIYPDDLAATGARTERALDPGIRDRTPYEYRVRRPDGEICWVRAHAEAVFEDGPDGPVAVRYTGTMQDVTESRRLEEALRDSEGRLRLALDAGRMAVWGIDEDGTVTVSPELNRLVGLPEDARPTLDDLQAQYAPGELERLQALAEGVLSAGERFLEAEYQHIRADDGRVRWLLVRAELKINETGQISSLGVVLDITERREAEDRLLLLAKEVDHRANNLLAVVQGAISLTRGDDLDAYRMALLGRVGALARAHQLLASSRWVGASLHQLVQDELQAYGPGDEKRVSVDGVAVELHPALAQGVAMVLHELATNAVKHGALSHPSGSVRISWEQSADGVVRLTWCEHGQTDVAVPSRRGLGLRMIERALGGELKGQTDLEWRRTGLCAHLNFRASAN